MSSRTSQTPRPLSGARTALRLTNSTVIRAPNRDTLSPRGATRCGTLRDGENTLRYEAMPDSATIPGSHRRFGDGHRAPSSAVQFKERIAK